MIENDNTSDVEVGTMPPGFGHPFFSEEVNAYRWRAENGVTGVIEVGMNDSQTLEFDLGDSENDETIFTVSLADCVLEALCVQTGQKVTVTLGHYNSTKPDICTRDLSSIEPIEHPDRVVLIVGTPRKIYSVPTGDPLRADFRLDPDTTIRSTYQECFTAVASVVREKYKRNLEVIHLPYSGLWKDEMGADVIDQGVFRIQKKGQDLVYTMGNISRKEYRGTHGQTDSLHFV